MRLQHVLAVASLVVATLAAAQVQPGEARREGDLKAFINPDSENVGTKLEVLRHTLDAVQQQLVAVQFRQEYGDVVRMEKKYIPNIDADLMPAYVFEPAIRKAGHVYPGIVLVHGGYHYSLDDTIFGFIVRAVAEGYVVIFPEYRGSRGYGAEYYNALNYGGKEVDDVLWAADYLGRRPYVDSSRMAIVGRSKGGMLTLLAIEKEPKRFKAAVDVVGLVDFVAYMSYKPEYRRRDIARQLNFGGKLPSENLPAYIEVSPLTHVDKIETPLLIHATTYDESVPVELHAQRLVDALTARGKYFEYKLYDHAPGGHGYAHGDSEAAHDSENRIFAFLAKYLKP